VKNDVSGQSVHDVFCRIEKCKCTKKCAWCIFFVHAGRGDDFIKGKVKRPYKEGWGKGRGLLQRMNFG
jgi:hypothetical protein